MKRQALIESAVTILPCSDYAAVEFENNIFALPEIVSTKIAAREDFDSLVGKQNTDLMRDNHRNQARFFHSLLVCPEPDALVKTCIWAVGVYRNKGFAPAYWDVLFLTWLEALNDQLSTEAAESIAPLFRWMHGHRHDFLELAEQDNTEE